MIALRDYQHDLVAAVEESFERGIRRPLACLPTGGGKTICFAEIIRRRMDHGRALILAHREELIEQAVTKLHMVYPEAETGVVKAERDDVLARIVVASVQTLAVPSRRRKLFDLAQQWGAFSTVIVDEAHHATADNTYNMVLEAAGSFRDDGPLTVGVTATAMRADGKPLGDIWQEIVYQQDILAMIRRGYLCDVRGIKVKIEMDLSGIHTRKGDLVVGELENALRDAEMPFYTAKAYHEHAPGRTAIVFTPTVRLAGETAEAMRAIGVRAEAVSAETPDNERRAILHRFTTGETQAIANVGILTEGYDNPRVDCILMARPTQSWVLFSQCIGRGLRTFPGKADCLIIDMVGNTSRHKLVNMSTLMGSEAAAVAVREGESVREAFARVEQEQLKLDGAKAKLLAETVDLFTAASAMSWFRVNDDHYFMDLADKGRMHLYTRDMILWGAWHVDRSGTKTEIVNGLDMGYAQGVAEDYCRRLGGAAALVNKAAAWRLLEPSDKQKETITKMRLPVPATRGEASDMITAAMAKRGFARR